MPFFEPPVAYDLPGVWPGVDPRRPVTPLARRLFRHFGGNPRGRSVLKAHDGTYTTVDTPSQDQIDASAVAYIGGHRYEVTEAEAAALTAAGFTVG